MKNNILISSVGKRVALVRYFKETLHGLIPLAKVYSSDYVPEMAAAGYVSDGCFPVPRVSDPNFIPELLEICERLDVGMIIPTIDTELMVLSKEKSRFVQRGIHIIVPDPQFVNICRDKRNTVSFFKNHGIDVPKEIDINHPTFPIFAKPYNGSLSANIHIIRSAEELTPSIKNDPKLMYMEYVDNTVYKEYTVDMYYGRDNNVKCIVPRERIEVRAGEINKGRTHKDYLVAFLKERFGHIDGCVGCVCMQIFYSEKTGSIYGIEINPRFGGGYPLSYMAGGNFPEMLIQEYFRNKTVEYSDTWKDGLLMLRFDDAVFI